MSQVPGLTNLQLDHSSSPSIGFYRQIPGLRSLYLKSLTEDPASWPIQVLTQHSDTLKHLVLGAESNVIRLHYQPQRSSDHVAIYDKIIDGVVKYLTADLQVQEGVHFCELDLDALEIVGLNVDKFETVNFSLFSWRNLTSLKLESCWGLEQLLNKLAPSKDSQGLLVPSSLRLHSFQMRHKYTNRMFRRQLLEFLVTLPGLTNLSVLLENENQPQASKRLKNVWIAHGKTLKTLVWDERKGPQIAYPNPDDRLPTAEHLVDIATHCAGLVELGVPCSWRTFATPCRWQETVRTPPLRLCRNEIYD